MSGLFCFFLFSIDAVTWSTTDDILSIRQPIAHLLNFRSLAPFGVKFAQIINRFDHIADDFFFISLKLCTYHCLYQWTHGIQRNMNGTKNSSKLDVMLVSYKSDQRNTHIEYLSISHAIWLYSFFFARIKCFYCLQLCVCVWVQLKQTKLEKKTI